MRLAALPVAATLWAACAVSPAQTQIPAQIGDDPAAACRQLAGQILESGQAPLEGVHFDRDNLRPDCLPARGAPAGLHGEGGTDWLPFSHFMGTGEVMDASAQGFEMVELPAGSQPQACMALCMAQAGCAAWSFEPPGSDFVTEPRCARFGYGARLWLRRDNAYYAGGLHFTSGLREDARNITPETAVLTQEILEDMRQIEAMRAATRLDAPAEMGSERSFTLRVEGPALEGDWVEITTYDDLSLWSPLSLSPVADRDSAGNLTIWAPEPGDYVLRYIVHHPRAGRHILAEQPLRISVDVAAPALADDEESGEAIGGRVSLSHPGTVAPGAPFAVAFDGPRYAGDWIDIITPGQDDDFSGGWSWAWADAEQAELNAPAEPGEYHLRYVAEHPQRGRVVLAQDVLVVTAQPVVAPD